MDAFDVETSIAEGEQALQTLLKFVSESAGTLEAHEPDGEQDLEPLMGFALAQAKPAPLHHVERRGLQGNQDTQQPILGGRQRTVPVGGVPPGGARLAIQAPVGHTGLECRLKGRDQLVKRLHDETG
jgi:hypothetical protein